MSENAVLQTRASEGRDAEVDYEVIVIGAGVAGPPESAGDGSGARRRWRGVQGLGASLGEARLRRHRDGYRRKRAGQEACE